MIPTHAELTAAMGQPAFIHPDEIPVLCKYAGMSKCIVEIGCAWGGMTTLMLLSMPFSANGYLASIDPFVQDSMANWSASEAACCNAVDQALRRLNQHDRLDQWALYTETSASAVAWWKLPCDMLLIDGSHLEADVRHDWGLWTPFVRQGGVILLHDSRRIPDAPDFPFPQGYAGPTALANDLRSDNRYKLVDEVFSLTCWEKLK